MRIWSYQLLPYLPDLQFKGQLRELVAIMHDWRDKGKTNHILINRVMQYPKSHLLEYFLLYSKEYEKRFDKPISKKIAKEFEDFCGLPKTVRLFYGWHGEEYLRICMANLLEKSAFGVGKTQLTMDEWNKLYYGYKEITGKDYIL